MKLIQRIRDSRTCKVVFVYLLLNISFEIAQPTVSLALTSGPSQPEVQSFEPIGTTDMVDVFTGDFNYNIPLMNIPGPNGGYPINLAYHAGISMDDEASWAGLGWNINNGALVRNVRGLPDDFDSHIDSHGDFLDGDFIERKMDQKQSVTAALSIGGSKQTEQTGAQIDLASWDMTLRFNNYRGLGYSVDYGTGLGKNSNFKVGLSLDSDDGLGVNVAYSFTDETKAGNRDYEFSLDFNGQKGLSASLTKQKPKEIKVKSDWNGLVSSKAMTSVSRSVKISYANTSFSPSIGTPTLSSNLSLNLLIGKAGANFHQSRRVGLTFSTEEYGHGLKNGKLYPVQGYEKAGLHANNSEYYTQDFTRQKDGMINRQTPILGHSYYTNDVYSFTGHGAGGFFRGRRGDIGRIHDPKMRNDVGGVAGSFEVSRSNGNATVTLNVTWPTPIAGISLPIGTTFPVPRGRKIGIGLDLTYGWNTQGAWSNMNEEKLDFKAPRPLGEENFYYQVHGQPTVLASNEMTHIGGEGTVRPALTSVGLDLERGISNSALLDERQVNGRMVRNTLVHAFRNDEMSKLPEFSSVGFYNWGTFGNENENSKSLSHGTQPTEFLRASRSMTGHGNVSIGGHNGGYKVLQEDGSYYVYGLPAYNTKEVNNLFSVEAPVEINESVEAGIYTNYSYSSEMNYTHDGTDNYINKTTQSPFAHSYMLTAIYGADYVDLTHNGPTDDDLGYWVKFEYVRYAEGYKWRAPYYGVSLNRGAHHTAEDDKASYSYGEKELWYLGRIQTSTHTAVFHLSERKDNVEAANEFSNNNSASGSSRKTGLKVDKISLYVKSDYESAGGRPLQEVHFEYDYSLCPNVYNNTDEDEIVNGTDINANEGKLTLKAMWFTALGSAKGRFNKYKFHYDYGDPGEDVYLANPGYALNRLDGWGGFKPGNDAKTRNKYFTYVDQFNQWPAQGPEGHHNDASVFEGASAKEAFQHYRDQFASAWCLKRIELPSGGEIRVDYESDDYAYVQDQEATQMFKITDVNDMADGLDKLYDEGANNFGDARSRRIYFKLEYPIPSTATAAEAAEEVYTRYVENIIEDENGDRNLFFKSFVQLKDLGHGDDDYEAVSGYLPLEANLMDTYYNYGVGTATSGGYFTHGFVTVKQTPKKSGGNFDYHPISLLAWQYMQTNTPKLMHEAVTIDESNNSNNGFLDQISDILNIVPAVLSSVGATRAYARGRNFAKKIDLDRSVIRLCSPDKKKFGGGHRVRKISVTDSWADMAGESNRTYGTEYDYTMYEDGEQISSGVAQYEPQASGDENALKYPLHFHGKNTFVSNNNLFAEHPFNEDLFPGASVGYRKVTVKSLNTGRQLRNTDTDPGNDEGTVNSGGTGGVTVYSFYTAKEFPTIVEYTNFNDSNDPHKSVLNLPLPIPLIGAYYRQYYHASQGFKIELNDMHGKPKSIETFELSPDYKVVGSPITSTTYEYQTKSYMHNGNSVMRLHNKVRVVSKDNPTVLAEGERDMGVEYDMYTDQRQNKSHTITAGGELNLDFPTIASPAAVPSFWPTFVTSKTLTRTYVTNKVIFKTGIMKRVVTRDLQSSSSSEIVAYDELSGQPLVTKGTNEFGDEIYSYNIPAYWHYDRMGHAYKNIDYTFQAWIYCPQAGADRLGQCALYVIPDEEMLNMLVRGDEVLFRRTWNGEPFKGYYADLVYNVSGQPRMLFYSVDIAELDLMTHFNNYEMRGFPEHEVIGRVVRSGRRNHYDAIAASYMTKGSVFDNIDGSAALVDGLTTPQMDNVISASATLFRDDWDNSLTVGASNEIIASNIFLSGQAGIWRPYKTYVYAGVRTGSADENGTPETDPDLRNDGVMNDVPMFSWDIGNIEEYQPKWEWASEISRYNDDSYEVENIDRLGIRSAALFGLGQNLSIAVGGNAGYHELGTMDFETSTASTADPYGLTNMIFYNNSVAPGQNYVSESARVIRLTRLSGGTYEAVLDLPKSTFDLFSGYIDNTVNLGLISRKTSSHAPNIGHFVHGTIQSSVSEGGKTKLILSDLYLLNDDSYGEYVRDGENYYGRATFLIDRDQINDVTNSGVSFVGLKAHTGKKSMKLTAGSSFLQKELLLKNANKYVVSMWVSRDDDNQYRFTTAGNDLVTLSVVNPADGTVTPVPSGTLKYSCSKVIEGWQKIDITFSMNVDYGILKINFTPGASALYVDDIRVSPFTGGISTCVYNPSNYRLVATLNADNYATFYYYDEQGNLVLRKQETENGIVTLNEARGHVRKQN